MKKTAAGLSRRSERSNGTSTGSMRIMPTTRSQEDEATGDAVDTASRLFSEPSDQELGY